MKRRHRVTGLVLLATICFIPAVAQTCRDADLLLRNGHIITMNEAKSVVGAMAVRDGRILALGDDDALAGMRQFPHPVARLAPAHGSARTY